MEGSEFGEFTNSELLLRAVHAPERYSMYWKDENHLTSAAFKSRKSGLSVDRVANRKLKDSIDFVRQRLDGCIVSVTFGECTKVGAMVKQLPVPHEDEYHCEIHRSISQICLSDKQARMLAETAIIQYNSITGKYFDNCGEINFTISNK